MFSKNDDHSTTGNVPDIVEMSLTQMGEHQPDPYQGCTTYFVHPQI